MHSREALNQAFEAVGEAVTLDHEARGDRLPPVPENYPDDRELQVEIRARECGFLIGVQVGLHLRTGGVR